MNAYIDEHLRTPILESNDISELNDMLMGQRSSEETLRNSLDQSHQLEQNNDDTAQVKELKRDLSETKARLKEVDSKFNKIKVLSKRGGKRGDILDKNVKLI